MTKPKAECGTYAGWNQHIRYDTPMCDDCRAAARAYQKQWRKDHPEKQKIQERYLVAADRARRELARRRPEEYRDLYQFFKKQVMADYEH